MGLRALPSRLSHLRFFFKKEASLTSREAKISDSAAPMTLRKASRRAGFVMCPEEVRYLQWKSG